VRRDQPALDLGSVKELDGVEGDEVVVIERRRPGLALDADASWRDLAKCRSEGPARFFPDGATGGALEQIHGAKQMCARCDVQAACLLFALETRQEDGIWGGTSEAERRRLRRAWLAARRQQARLTA